MEATNISHWPAKDQDKTDILQVDSEVLLHNEKNDQFNNGEIVEKEHQDDETIEALIKSNNETFNMTIEEDEPTNYSLMGYICCWKKRKIHSVFL